MENNYSLLIKKLDQFTRKYYINEILRGAIYFAALFLMSLLLVSTLEYFGNFGTTVRLVGFYAFVSMNAVAFLGWLLVPLTKLLRIGKVISHRQAAQIIGEHFTNVKDKLLNTLELQESSLGSRDLIMASIEQKMLDLKPVPFSLAVNFATNKKYIKYALIPLLVVVLLLIQVPDVILKSSARLISYNKEFLPVAPFNFVLENEDLKILHHDDFEIKLRMEGDELPAIVRVNVDGNDYRMVRNTPTEFSYLLRNVDKSTDFSFLAAGFRSGTYDLEVLPRPFLKSFEVTLEYPGYIGKQDEVLENIGDLTLPEGTMVKWKFAAENSEQLLFNWNGSKQIGERTGANSFRYSRQVMSSGQYYVQSTNNHVPVNDSIGYGVQVIKDAHPTIKVTMEGDTTSLKSYFFSGELSDDYGISGLTFNYRYTQSEDKNKLQNDYQRINLGVNSKSIQSFFHHWDLREAGYEAGDELEFFFEVWDNDGVNGRKSTKSRKLSIKAPDKSEIEDMVAETSTDIKDDLKETMKQAAEVQKELEDVQNRLMNKKRLSWEDKQAVSKLMEKQESLNERIESINKKYDEMLKQQDEFSKIDEKIRDKHQQLQKLFEQLMDEETKQMFEELQKLLEENAENLDENLDDIELSNEELEKELDAALEHFKQLELEQKMEETVEKLDDLADEQKKLAEETENGEKSKEELEQKQEELNKEFEELKEDLEQIEEMNEGLEKPNDLDDTQEQQDDISENMKQSSEDIKKGKNKKASDKQEDAAEKMDEMKKQMEENMKSMEMESLDIDYDALRQIMENLIYLSFEQERLIEDLNKIQSYNPKYINMAREQRKLVDDAKMIEDSLTELSKRVMMISGFINKEVGQMNYHLEQTMEYMGERQIQEARKHQQYVMTHVNNLAVMLSEVMDQMQQQMSQQMSGKQNCQNPKKGKKPGQGNKKKLGNMRQMQEQLGKQLSEMKKKMEGGQRPLSKDLAKAAGQQEALRRELQKFQEMKEGQGEPSNELKEIQEMMDEMERDIVNQQITTETLMRQQEIINKLLESEKAEREEEWDNQRESTTAEQLISPSQKAFEEYKRERMKEIELLNSVPPQLNNYYKQKVQEYFEEIN